ncbi:MAG: hypothetical protein HYX43_18415 [Burkholderiales bacterium]|nr:hypothetical protein [Burkholderiales bacterium]
MASQAVVRDATDKAQFRLRAAQCHINPRQSKVLERLLEAGHVGSGGGFLGGMTTEKYAPRSPTPPKPPPHATWPICWPMVCCAWKVWEKPRATR